ncbi:MAG: hypothetical protein K0U98_09210 [Deltaproteobacteria bacterium]|nr:hypothetical protein [Deltaproteobacteria bacterium]
MFHNNQAIHVMKSTVTWILLCVCVSMGFQVSSAWAASPQKSFGSVSDASERTAERDESPQAGGDSEEDEQAVDIDEPWDTNPQDGEGMVGWEWIHRNIEVPILDFVRDLLDMFRY